jgi:hypothetical protein
MTTLSPRANYNTGTHIGGSPWHGLKEKHPQDLLSSVNNPQTFLRRRRVRSEKRRERIIRMVKKSRGGDGRKRREMCDITDRERLVYLAA